MTLRMPKGWGVTATAEESNKEVKAGIDMSADTVNNLVDPSNGEPMEIVQMYCLNGDGSRDITLVAANRNSRIVLPLSNEMLAKMGAPAADPNGSRAAELAAAQAVQAIGNPFV